MRFGYEVERFSSGDERMERSAEKTWQAGQYKKRETARATAIKPWQNLFFKQS